MYRAVLILSWFLLSGPSLSAETPPTNKPVESAVCHDIEYVTRSYTKCINIDESNIVVFTSHLASFINSTNSNQKDIAFLFLARPATALWNRPAFENIKSIETYSIDENFCRKMTRERFVKFREAANQEAKLAAHLAKAGELPEVLAKDAGIRYLWGKMINVPCRKLTQEQLDYILN